MDILMSASLKKTFKTFQEQVDNVLPLMGDYYMRLDQQRSANKISQTYLLAYGKRFDNVLKAKNDNNPTKADILQHFQNNANMFLDLDQAVDCLTGSDRIKADKEVADLRQTHLLLNEIIGSYSPQPVVNLSEDTNLRLTA